jgi:hypothetical protein
MKFLKNNQGSSLTAAIVASAIGASSLFFLSKGVSEMQASSKKTESNLDLNGIKVNLMTQVNCAETFGSRSATDPCPSGEYIDLKSANGRVLVSQDGSAWGKWTIRAFCSTELDVRAVQLLPGRDKKSYTNFARRNVASDKSVFRKDELLKGTYYDFENPKSKIFGSGMGVPLCGDRFGGTVSPGGTVPPGGIILWSGGVIPAGWALCDGSNGTPDLRDRFVIGQVGLMVPGLQVEMLSLG